MSLTIDCGEGKHTVCSGSGTDVYLIPQESGDRFYCGCGCHHDRASVKGVPCQDPDCPSGLADDNG